MDDDEALIPAYQPPTFDGPVSDDALLTAAQDFDSSLKAKYSSAQYTALRTIGAFIMRGMALRECCILSRVDPDKLDALIAADPDVRSFIEFKQIAYKATLMKSLAGSAAAGAVKSSAYLLEKQYRSEFGKQSKDDPNLRTPDIIERALEAIRDSEGSPIISQRLES